MPAPAAPRRRTAFVAAPLIGTIIFLSSILFVVNLSKYETAQVSYSVSDAYNNRISSLLEMYRSDMAAVFSVGLSRSIEKFLLSQCWTSPPFGIEVNALTWSAATEYDQRLNLCNQLNGLIQSSVCTINPLYGINNWLDYLNQSISFEGISFEPANPVQFAQLTSTTAGLPVTDPTTGEVRYLSGSQVCSAKLIDAASFDCEKFAAGQLACKDQPGCENGVFYVKVQVEDPAVYPNLPRVRASDGAGNVIRSGALSDRTFHVPINFPLFRYYDMSYQYVKLVLQAIGEGYCIGDDDDCQAKGAKKKANVEGSRELYFNGQAGGGGGPPTGGPSGGGNSQLQQYANQDSDSSEGSTLEQAAQDAQKKAGAKLVSKTFTEIIDTVQNDPRFSGLGVEVSYSSNLNDLLNRSTFVDRAELEGDDGLRLATDSGSPIRFRVTCKNPQLGCQTPNGKYRVAAYLDSLFLPSRIVDYSPLYRANPNKANDFCFTPRWVSIAQP
jgi:hypothetical protein